MTDEAYEAATRAIESLCEEIEGLRKALWTIKSILTEESGDLFGASLAVIEITRKALETR